jgi:hypothetical protein
MRRWLIRVGAVAFVLFGTGVVYVVGAAFYWQMFIGMPLEQDLGFQHGSPYVQEGGSSGYTEVLAIEAVVPGGVFDRAGFRNGDVVRGMSSNELFQSLHRGRGQQVTIRVVDGGDGPPLDQRPERVIAFEVPARGR